MKLKSKIKIYIIHFIKKMRIKHKIIFYIIHKSKKMNLKYNKKMILLLIKNVQVKIILIS
jgi:hypothetical protein